MRPAGRPSTIRSCSGCSTPPEAGGAAATGTSLGDSDRGVAHDRVEPDRSIRSSSSPRRAPRGIGRARPDRQDARRRRAHGRPLVPDVRPSGGLPTVLIRTPYGRTIMGPLGRLYAERGYQVVVQSCRGTFGSGGEFVPVRNEQVDGKATLEWVAAQPWFDGRLVMWGASYLGMTQWAVAQDAPDFLQALSLQVTAANFRDSVVFPGGAFALETGLAWLHEIKNQELGWRTVLRAQLRGCQGGAARRARSCRWGSATARPSASPWPSSRIGSSTARPGDQWWDERRLRAPARQRAAGQLHRRLVRPLPAGAGGRLRGAPPRRALGPPDHRPVDARQPRPVRRDRARRPTVVRQPARGGRPDARAPGRAGARVRHGLAHVAGVLHVAAGGEDRAVVSRAGRHAGAGRRRATTSRRTGTTTTPATPRRRWAARRSTWPRRGARSSARASAGATCSRTPAPC